MSRLLEVSQEVSSAISMNQPVVALESCLIAHGLPEKINVETALEMERVVRAGGAVPATIGMVEGKIKVGLSKEDIERLGKGGAAKLAPRDIPYAAARKLDGGTTVAATARIASTTGIPVMVTGGIGGVHRGFAETMDISADLWELARTPILVVCSGAKAILDIPATLDWLETHGVLVFGYQTSEFPAFYSRSSGVEVPNVEGVDDLLDVLTICRSEMAMSTAAIVGVPIPASCEIDVSREIQQAADEAHQQGIRGKELTPYMLNRIGELTSGKATIANAMLLKNNCVIGAEIATALARNSQRKMGF